MKALSVSAALHSRSKIHIFNYWNECSMSQWVKGEERE